MTNKRVCGVGHYDSDTPSRNNPLHYRWANMLHRCYDYKCQKKNPSYVGCSVAPEWMLYSNFEKWCTEREWFGLDLDKDLICIGNKVYSPEYVSFVPRYVNLSVVTRKAQRGAWPLGVVEFKRDLKAPYCAQISYRGSRKSLGYYKTPERAHRAWQQAKIEDLGTLVDEYRMESCWDLRVECGVVQRISLLKQDITSYKITEAL
jgi:hypothetical protein